MACGVRARLKTREVFLEARPRPMGLESRLVSMAKRTRRQGEALPVMQPMGVVRTTVLLVLPTQLISSQLVCMVLIIALQALQEGPLACLRHQMDMAFTVKLAVRAHQVLGMVYMGSIERPVVTVRV